MNKYASIVSELGGHFLSDYPGSGSEGIKPPQTTEAELAAAEAQLGYPLPADYREFLRDFGAYNLPARYPFNGPENYTSGYVGIMFGIGRTSYDVVQLHRDNLDNTVIADELLQMTADEMGSICLFLDGPRKGQVHLWYGAEVRENYDYSNLYFIANSFDEFMHLLQRYEDD